MRYGIAYFPTDYATPPGEMARLVEDRGFDSLWFPEHTHIPVNRRTPWPGGPELPRQYVHLYDPFIAATAAAMTTRDLKVATGICLVAEHDPFVTAKQVATLDQVSNGRFIFGIGGGWNQEEMENHGTDFRKRFAVLRERVLAMRVLWTQEEAEFHGRYVDFNKVWSFPKPKQSPHPRILMGGDGPTTIKRVLEFCDGWMPICRGGKLPGGLRERVPALRKLWQEAGRDPESLSVEIHSAPPEPEALREMQAAGIDRAIFMLPSVSGREMVAALDEHVALVARPE